MQDDLEPMIRSLLSGPDVDFDRLIAPEARISTFMRPHAGTGPDAVRRYWTDAEAIGWTIDIEVEAIKVDGKKALAYGKLHARKGPLDDANDLVWAFRVEGGLVQEVIAFVDPIEAAAWLDESGGKESVSAAS